MYFKQLAIGGYDNNFSYALGDEETKEVFLVDPDNYDYLIQFLQDEGLKLKGILLTHGHFDHVGCCDRLSKEKKVPIYLHKADFDLAGGGEFEDLTDKESLKVGNLEIKIIPTPGHTQGSVCFSAKNKLITGDTLFVGGYGRTDFPYSSSADMKKSIARLEKLSDNTEVYPGHDYGNKPFSTIEEEK